MLAMPALAVALRWVQQRLDSTLLLYGNRTAAELPQESRAAAKTL
jgi:hypothetical protein